MLNRSAFIGRKKEFSLITNTAFQVLLDSEIFMSRVDTAAIVPNCVAHLDEKIQSLSS